MFCVAGAVPFESRAASSLCWISADANLCSRAADQDFALARRLAVRTDRSEVAEERLFSGDPICGVRLFGG